MHDYQKVSKVTKEFLDNDGILKYIYAIWQLSGISRDKSMDDGLTYIFIKVISWKEEWECPY